MSKEIEAGLVPNNEISTQNPNVPKVTRDERGNVRWTLPGNSLEENEQMGIRNVQGLFLEVFPDFLERFPLGEDGKIVEDQREEAKNFVSKTIGNQKKFYKFIGASSSNSHSAPYFVGSYRIGINKSFSPWGIEIGILKHSSGFWTPEQIKKEALAFYQTYGELNSTVMGQNGKVNLVSVIYRYYPGGLQQIKEDLGLEVRKEDDTPSRLRLVDNRNYKEFSVTPLNQKTGLGSLIRFFKGELSLNDVDPIYITDIKKSKIREGQHCGLLYVGTINGHSLQTKVNLDTYNAYQRHGRLLAVPMEEPRFGYQWLDFYGVGQENTVDLNDRLESIRINRERSKFESKGWFGPEQQAFSDFISGKININPDELPPFTTKISRFNKEKVIYFGRIKGQAITTSISNSVKTSSSEIVIVPKYDSQRKFFWIEGYDEKDYERSSILFTKRVIIDDSNRVKIVDLEHSGIEWTDLLPEQRISLIEKISAQFISEGNSFTQVSLKNAGMYYLYNAAHRFYPGGFRALKEKLGFATRSEDTISPDQAREDLWKYLEVEENSS